MGKGVQLSKVAKYSKKRIEAYKVSLENFVTIDNILQNKAGITSATNLPPSSNAMPAYEAGHILVGNIRPYLKKIWFADRTGGCSNDVLNIEVNKGHDPKFVYYALFRDDFFTHMMKGKKGTKMPRGDKNQIMDFLVPDLEYKTQQKIAAVLSAFDAKIELNQRLNAELESLAKTLYDYWFVQFEYPTPTAPIGAPPPNTTGDRPSYLGEAGRGYKSAGGKMVWNEKLGKKVPEGWEVKPLGKVLKTNLGGTPLTKVPEYWENATIPWLNSGDLTEFPIIKSSSFVTQKGVDNSATTILPRGSVVISLVRYIRPSIIALEACANQSVVGIRETDEIKNSYIYPYLVNEVPRYMALRTGAQQPHINKEAIDDTMFYIPPHQILQEFYKVSEPIYKKIVNLAFESQTLTELRDWLLPMLMNGQVTIQTSEVLKTSEVSGRKNPKR